ncbi:hypothetical protein ACFXN2_20825 [Streptomyces kronopolitis]|uniref:Cytochrome C oxidase subunit I n=1 Tax=Streptomyces kronopolitis TaxID=1612435 RepID=A0ABQ2JYJ0_9ACTN|nr:hypothetical protein [Streptomyces kronopolitis]GGN61233.1 hypothetical protein GCM10012285_60010 [Streptomyces kronopolitis]
MNEGTQRGQGRRSGEGAGTGGELPGGAGLPHLEDMPGADGAAMDRAINEIEGFLLWEAEKDRARLRAEAFCAGLPWLTDTQRREVEQHYCRDQRDAAWAYLERIAHRSTTLRTEYEGVYRALRRRLITAVLSGTLAVAALVAVAVAGMAVR